MTTFWSFLWGWLRILLVLFPVLTVIVIGGGGWLLSGQRYQTFLAEQLSTRLPAQVGVTRSDLSIAQGLGLALHRVEIQPQPASKPMLTAEHVAVLLDIRALLCGQLLFHRVEWKKPRITLTKASAEPFAVFKSTLSGGDIPIVLSLRLLRFVSR